MARSNNSTPTKERDTGSPWMDLAEASAYLKCRKQFLEDLVESRGIPHVVLDGRPLFHVSALDDWLLAQQVPAHDTRSSNDTSEFETNTVSIQSPCDRNQVDRLVSELLGYRTLHGKEDRFVKGLATNLQFYLNASEWRSVPLDVYKRLARWIHPNRLGDREVWVRERAAEISLMLFGKVIDRLD